MKKISIYILPLVTVFSFTLSCEKNVDIDIDVIDNMIVMNGILKADSSANIYLSRTRHILDNREISELTDARVEISDLDGNTEILSFNEDKVYNTDKLELEPG
jgi:hypothetical protein